MPYDLSIAGWTSEGDLREIEYLAAQVPPGGLIVEIGSFYGRTAYAWAKSCHPSTVVHCIDTWHGWSADKTGLSGNVPDGEVTCSIDGFLQNVGSLPNIRYSVGISLDVIPSFAPKSIDLIFLDGDHTNPVLKFELAFCPKLLKDGGWLVGHDFSTKFPDVVTEVVRTARRCAKPVRFAPFSDSTIWSIRM
jgi:predicted O-methyltransferase YrrM